LEEDLYGRVLLRIGRGALVFEHREHAELVLTILKERGKVSKEELLGWEIPLTPAKAKEWTEELRQLSARANELGKSITNLEEQIDGRVVQLYGLEQGDVEVIENQLLKFEQCASAEKVRRASTEESPVDLSIVDLPNPSYPESLADLSSIVDLPNPSYPELLEYVCPEDGCTFQKSYPKTPLEPGYCPVHGKKLVLKKR
jgi:hypothetical protein